MLEAGCQENESCSKVLNFLERLDNRIRCTHEETVNVELKSIHHQMRAQDLCDN